MQFNSRKEPGEERYEAHYRFQVTESFDSAIIPGSTIDIVTGTGGADCSWHFTLHTQYLVDAYHSWDGQLFTSICTHTTDVERAKPLLLQLRAIQSGHRPPSLVGQLLERDEIALRTGNWGQEFRKLEMVTITARALRGSDISSITDKDGTFVFPNLAPGTYTLSAGLPSRLKLYHGFSEDTDSTRVVIPASSSPVESSCRAFLDAEPSASITGKIVLPPARLKDTVVQADLLHDGRYIEIRDDFPDTNGNFKLPSLPTGHYRLTFSAVSFHSRIQMVAFVDVADETESVATLHPSSKKP